LVGEYNLNYNQNKRHADPGTSIHPSQSTSVTIHQLILITTCTCTYISTCSCSDDTPDWDTSDKCELNIFQAECAGVETYAPPLGVEHTVATFSGVLIGSDIEHAAVSAYL